MTPQRPMLTDILMSLHTPAVRDLAWTLGSPPSIFIQGDPRLCSTQYYDDLLSKNLDWLAELDGEPASLIAHLNHHSSYRLGSYFEGLISYWLKHTHHWQLVAHDHQVREDKITLGAFDFVIKNGEMAEHWEVAIKYYLGVGGESEWSQWIGPNQRDRLDLKMHRMLSHQIELSQHPAGQTSLTELGLRGQPTQRVWIKGQFFSPWDVPTSSPLHATSGTLGAWIDAATVDDYLDQCCPSTMWTIRQKPDWLSPTIRAEYAYHDRSTFRSWVTTIERPIMVSEVTTETKGIKLENRRIFLVPTYWRQRAQKLVQNL